MLVVRRYSLVASETITAELDRHYCHPAERIPDPEQGAPTRLTTNDQLPGSVL